MSKKCDCCKTVADREKREHFCAGIFFSVVVASFFYHWGYWHF